MEKYRAPSLANLGALPDLAPDTIPAGGWNVARNVHIFANKMKSVGGSRLIANEPSDSVPGHIQFAPFIDGKAWITAGAGNATAGDIDWVLWTWDGASFVDRTPAAIDETVPLVSPWQWTSCIFGGVSIFNHPELFPMYLTDISAPTDFVALPWDATDSWQDKGFSCLSMSQFKNFLFAIGMVEAAVELPYVVRWSNVADTGSIPNTWDETDLAAVAGSVPLPAEGGKPICGLPLRDSFLVYSEKSIHAFDLIGGQFIFNVRVVSNEIGIISSNAVVEHDGFHYFIGQDDVYKTDGNTVEPIGEGKIKGEFTQSLDRIGFASSFVFASERFNEIWFCIPVAQQIPNYAFIYNVAKQAFTTCDLDTTYHMAAGYPVDIAPQSWQTQDVEWENDNQIWNAASTTSSGEEIRFATLDGITDSPEFRVLNLSGFDSDYALNSHLERHGILPAGDPDIICTALELVLSMNTNSAINIRITTYDTPYGAESGTTQNIEIPAGGRRAQFRITGRYFGIRINSLESTEFTLVDYTLSYVVDGLR